MGALCNALLTGGSWLRLPTLLSQCPDHWTNSPYLVDDDLRQDHLYIACIVMRMEIELVQAARV